jgi:uncharacterized protein (UPF0332 family)
VTPAESITAETLWAKAARAAVQAGLLLEAGEPDGAVSRAYYAMLSAARAVLLPVDRTAARAKRHETIHGAFAKHFVAPGILPAQMSDQLRLARKLRRRADYDVPPVTQTEAASLVDAMDHFLRVARGVQVPSGGS